MILATTVVALPLAAIALLARRFRSSLEEVAWRLLAVAMIAVAIAQWIPRVDIGVVIPMLTTEEVVSFTEPPRERYDESAPSWMITIYAIVTAVLLLRLLIAVAVAERLRTNANRLRVAVTAGILQPAIVLPLEAEQWSATKRAAVIAHEQAHVVRRDPLWRFIGRLAVAICWFQPLAWLAARSIERLAEEAADREGIAAAGNRHAYAGLLLEIVSAMAGSPRRLLASSMLDRSSIARRLDAILDFDGVRPRRSSVAAVVLSFFMVASVFASTMTKVQVPPPAIGVQLSDAQLLRLRDKYRQTVRNNLRAFFRGFRSR